MCIKVLIYFHSESQHNDTYSETKAQGEALVLAANGKSGLVTCAIRPSSIFGPGDRLLVPSLVSAARSGKMKVTSEFYSLLGSWCQLFFYVNVKDMDTSILLHVRCI